MASFVRNLVNIVCDSQPNVIPAKPNQKTRASITELFPKVDGENCDHDCTSCVVKYPKSFKINQDDEIYGNIDEWSTHLLVATGKSDWIKNVADEEGSLIEAIVKSANIEPNKMMLSASNIPIPTSSDGYSDSTTVLLLPAWLIIENVTPKSVNTLIAEFVNKGPTNTSMLSEQKTIDYPPPNLPGNGEQLISRPCPHNALILLCSHGTRDARCGQTAPLLKRELERHLREYGLLRDLHDENPGGVGIYLISHVGGHRYASNVIVYRKENAFGLDMIEDKQGTSELIPQPRPAENASVGAAQCIWLARVRPEDCQSIIKYTILRGKVVKPDRQLRGGFDRRRQLFSW